ncbi:hypothetical protein [Streptomyces sp. NPDC086147]|uniref:hypothetical protein n=1 Tax=Streptomyces sp. NPDC086147 TaxID=3155295 RepID=UPI00344E4514
MERGTHVACRSASEGLGAHTAPDLTVELRRHCVAFCAATAVHHGGEDAGLFPCLARVEETGPRELRGEFERLRSGLEAHFAYEEAGVVPLLRAADRPLPG